MSMFPYRRWSVGGALDAASRYPISAGNELIDAVRRKIRIDTLTDFRSPLCEVLAAIVELAAAIQKLRHCFPFSRIHQLTRQSHVNVSISQVVSRRRIGRRE